MKRRAGKKAAIAGAVFLAAILLFVFTPDAAAQALPKITLGLDKVEEPEEFSVALQILILLTVLSLAPAILVLTTSFTRILVIFSFLRHALATQQMPPNQILVGLSLFLTFFVMKPVFHEMNETGIKPYLASEITQTEALKRAEVPLREFMLRNVREKDLGLFISLSGGTKPNGPEDLSLFQIIPAFVISELRIAFQIGFLIYVPFLVVDMIVSSVLMSMGMLMLPPIVISLPFKILLFVLTDGWYLLTRSLVGSFS